MNMVGWTMYRALMFFLYLQTHHMFSQGVLTHVWYNDYKSIHRNVTASVESAAHRLHRQPALLRGWILCCQRWAGENNARTCNWRPAFIFISQTEWLCGCARRCCAKCKLTGWKWLKTKAGLSSFAILNSGNMAEAIRTCYCNCAVYETLHTVFVSTAFKRKTSTISLDAHCAPLLKYRSEGKTNSQSFSRVQYGSFLLDSSCLYFLCGLRCSQEVQRNYSLTKIDSLFFFICSVQRGERWHKFNLSNI